MSRMLLTVLFLLALADVAAGGESQVEKSQGGVTTIVQTLPTLEAHLLRTTPEPVYELDGILEFGSDRSFAKLVGQRRGGWLMLNSDGGVADAAIKIGRLVRERGIKTYVGKQRRCLSGCAIIWAAGTDRWVEDKAQIGFHGSYHFEDGVMVHGDPAELEQYFRDLGYPDTAIEKFMWPPEGLFWLTKQSAARIGVEAHFRY